MGRILEALKYVRDVGPIHKTFGICTNTIDSVGKAVPVSGWLHTKAIEWCGSGRGTPDSDMIYPVGGATEYEEDSLNCTVWSNPKRIAYLNWLIEKAEQEDV